MARSPTESSAKLTEYVRRGRGRRKFSRLLLGEKTLRMKNPPHPGQHVKLDCLDPLGLSITKAAEILGVSRLTLSNLVIGVIIRLSLKEDYAEVAPIHHKNGCR